LAITLLYLAIRIPLLNKPLQHDEIYFTSTYLHTLPSINKPADVNAGGDEAFVWSNDWQRHLSFRLPSVFLFYYYWDKVFGDSETSVHLPALILGLLGVIIYYYLGLLLFTPRASLLAAAATALSISHIGLSTTASFLIFEYCIFGASLLSLAKFMLTWDRKLLYLTLLLNIFGILIFYHYFAYLFLQTLLFWFNKDKLRIPRYYFICAGTVLLGFTMMFCYFYLHGWFDYGTGFWLTNNLPTLLSVVVWLPFSFSAEKVISGSLKVPILLFCCIPFFLSCIGSVKIMSASFKTRDTHSIQRAVILISFILPFTLYFIGGIFGVNVGHGQNFFYLLTVYYLFGFYGLEKLNVSNRLKNFSLAVIFASFTLFATLGSPILWKYRILEKEMARIASTIKTDFSILVTQEDFINSYYARQYSLIGKSFLFMDFETEENTFLSYLNECAENKPKTGSFTVIRKITEEEKPLNNNYIIGKNIFRLVKTDLYRYDYFPFRSLQKMIRHPLVLEVDTFTCSS
jgi:hypothetical protein